MGIPRKLRKQVVKRDKWCVVCGGQPTQVHHIIPLGRGGLNVPVNLMGVCARCHTRLHQDPDLLKVYQKQLLNKLESMFERDRIYSVSEISSILEYPASYVKRAVGKRLKQTDQGITGENVIRWVMAESSILGEVETA